MQPRNPRVSRHFQLPHRGDNKARFSPRFASDFPSVSLLSRPRRPNIDNVPIIRALFVPPLSLSFSLASRIQSSSITQFDYSINNTCPFPRTAAYLNSNPVPIIKRKPYIGCIRNRGSKPRAGSMRFNLLGHTRVDAFRVTDRLTRVDVETADAI